VATKLEKEVLYNYRGEEVDIQEVMIGRPTYFKLLHPENVLFVSKTRCNTNIKGDGHVDSEFFVLPIEAEDCGVDGIVTDIHFSDLSFTSRIGNPVRCAAILRSKKGIKDIPMNWN
jgi:hypothetical protein